MLGDLVLTCRAVSDIVDDGVTFEAEPLMMSGAWPPPAPSDVEGMDGALPLMAIDGGFRQNLFSFKVSVGSHHWTSFWFSDREETIVDGRGASCPVPVRLRGAGAQDIFLQRGRVWRHCLCREPDVHPERVRAWDHPPNAGARVQVVRERSGAGCGAASQHVGSLHQRFLASACGQNEHDVVSNPPAVQDLCLSPEIPRCREHDNDGYGLRVRDFRPCQIGWSIRPFLTDDIGL